MQHPILLGVNIDHVATLRQQRYTPYPDPVEAALLAEKAGADGITAHLREDRRHIQDFDIIQLQKQLSTRLNFEFACTETMLELLLQVRPEHCCMVPEKREELTTEGGLDVIGNSEKISQACKQLTEIGIEVSLFIDPDKKQIDAAVECGAKVIEIHTGRYAEAKNRQEFEKELNIIRMACEHANRSGLTVNAGHGLNYVNVTAIAEIPTIHELNIGHGIVARAVFVGMTQAVQEMKTLMLKARGVQ